ncbi:putative uncharacterized protein DDB_G0281733 [Colletes gigas]|uniref:putative uncharacterized protein DDB_G0281733 n=1 Tax=Colletes gigas TaxID=935657 RepID=UPI001C9BB03A|nr:putative uncharacterized protein DDB_G0281733 [Colletes gigas]
MSRPLRGERDHVSRFDLREQRDLRDLRDLHDIRDLRDLRDLRDVRDVRDNRERHGSGRHHRDEYLDYDHHPTAASTSALTNNPGLVPWKRPVVQHPRCLSFAAAFNPLASILANTCSRASTSRGSEALMRQTHGR